ncbi:MAG: imidazole glycerol phosphate synthase subunit HisH [Acidobacteria bacterium]|nr:imidazole glycerol phosphate synthase subunit HisH [Acidobacteriota bacterium]MBI3279845.1 imidazole glycerol phosphate synthase subunit HisH [Acidobacteriota bacterium]
MIAILDYGAGNLRSVQNTLDELGAAYTVTNRPGALARAEKVILPGVGHFGQMMRALDKLGLREPVRAAVTGGSPFLGICLGLQALFETSAEDAEVSGLGVFPGRVERFPQGARVPQMGWNQLEPLRPARLLDTRPYVYFAHSYYCPVIPATAATCSYADVTYTAVLECGNTFGVQFHPEKSGAAGLKIVKRFIEL